MRSLFSRGEPRATKSRAEIFGARKLGPGEIESFAALSVKMRGFSVPKIGRSDLLWVKL